MVSEKIKNESDNIIQLFTVKRIYSPRFLNKSLQIYWDYVCKGYFGLMWSKTESFVELICDSKKKVT